jgi:hypothetical protein
MTFETGQALWIRDWADRIGALGLSPFVIPLLEIARAFGPVGSHVALAVEPFLSGLDGSGSVRRVASVLEDPELVDLLETFLNGRAS